MTAFLLAWAFVLGAPVALIVALCRPSARHSADAAREYEHLEHRRRRR